MRKGERGKDKEKGKDERGKVRRQRFSAKPRRGRNMVSPAGGGGAKRRGWTPGKTAINNF